MIRKIEKGSLEIWYQVLGIVQTNCYLALDRKTRDAVLIDPADNCSEIARMQQEAGARICGILLTHGHFDHIMAAEEASRRFHAEIYACEEEKELLADADMNCSGSLRGKRVVLEAGRWLRDGAIVSLGSLAFQAIHTPGHTKGGMCYYFSRDGVLFSGDTLFFESVGRTDLPTGNGGEIVRSIKEKLMVLPGETLVLPGHGSQTTIDYEKKNNPYIDNNFWE